MTAPEALTRWEVAEADFHGVAALMVLPVILERDDPTVREGIARRRITDVTGRCPCGAIRVLPNRAERRAAVKSGRTLHVDVVHEDGCPATDATLRGLLRGDL